MSDENDNDNSEKTLTDLRIELSSLREQFDFKSLTKLDKLKNLSELKNLKELKALDQLKILEKIDYLKNFKSEYSDFIKQLDSLSKLSNLQELSKLEQLSSLSQLSQLEKLDNLKALDNLEQLEQLNNLEKLEKLTQLGQLDKIDNFIQALKDDGDKLEGLQYIKKLDELKNLTKLDNLAALDKLSNLSKLERLDNLTDLNNLDKLSHLRDLSSLKDLDKLDSLKELEKLSALQSLERLEPLMQSSDWKKLDLLDKLDILKEGKSKLALSLVMGFFLDLIKIVTVAAILLFFVLTQVNNDQLTKVLGYVNIHDAEGVNLTLPILHKTNNKLNFDYYVNLLQDQLNSEATHFWNIRSNESVESKLDRLHYLHKINFDTETGNISDSALKSFASLKKHNEGKYEDLMKSLSKKYTTQKEKFTKSKQLYFLYFNGRCEEAISHSYEYEKYDFPKNYLKLTRALALSCLYQQKKGNKQEVIKLISYNK